MGTPVVGYAARAALALGALLLALCVVATAGSDGVRWSAPERDGSGAGPDEEADRDATTNGSRDADEGRDEAEAEEPGDAPAWLPAGRLAALALLVALVAATIGLVARLRVSLRRRRLKGDQLRTTLTLTGLPDPEEDPDEEPLADALGCALGDLAHGSPRNSIVAAWLRLEQAAETRWFERNPADTPSEFVERVLSSYALDAEATRRLAALYREARFSDHRITDRQRDEAHACLSTLLSGIRSRTRGGLR